MSLLGTDTHHGDSRSGWCLVGDHDHCRYQPCPCPCHEEKKP